MPVRKRRDKRSAEQLSSWATAFELEYDLFNDLRDAGVPTDANGRPSLEDTERAWHRFGEAFLDDWNAQPRHPNAVRKSPWALQVFGAPKGRNYAG